jgi:hypothetical protein
MQIWATLKHSRQSKTTNGGKPKRIFIKNRPDFPRIDLRRRSYRRIHDCHACHACHAREKTLYHNRSHAIMVGEVFTLYHNNNSDQKGVKCIFLLFLGTAPERKKNS